MRPYEFSLAYLSVPRLHKVVVRGHYFSQTLQILVWLIRGRLAGEEGTFAAVGGRNRHGGCRKVQEEYWWEQRHRTNKNSL